MTDIWRDRNIAIRRIQQNKLSIYLSQHCDNIEKILYAIGMLKSEEQYPKYRYQFLQVFLTLVSVVIAAFFAAMTAVPDMFSPGNL